MKALILKAVNELELSNEVPKPKPAKNEVLIKVKYCGICGSDVEAYKYGKVLMPIILGHEFSGEIEEIGSEVVDWNIGDRVTAHPVEFCGKCYYCKKGEENRCLNMRNAIGLSVNGALAEYVKIPSNILCKLPDSVSYEKGALAEPLAVGYHGVKHSGIQPIDVALVIGAGAIGLSTIQALKLINVKNIFIIDPSEFNRNLALQMGAKNAAQLSRISKLGPNFVFQCVGSPKAYRNAIDIVQKGGVIILLGVHFELIPISILQLITKEVTMRGSLCTSLEEFKEIINLISQKRIQTNLILSKKVKLEEVIEEGFHELLQPERKAAKILVEI